MSLCDMTTLAAATTQPGGIGSVIGWSLVLMMLVLLGFFIVIRVKKWLQEDDEPAAAGGFTLSDLRELHRAGQMSDEEFERAKAQMLAGAKSMASKLPDPLARPDRPPSRIK